MESFEGKLAVVTGGGTGMGRELVIQLAAEGCHVAACDIILDNLEETARRAEKEAPAGTRITIHRADVADESDMQQFAKEVLAEHSTDHVNLVFNNAGVGGGGSFIQAERSEWDRTFGICWGGVYNGCRAFVPLLVASDEGHLVNTSSVNGFWAMLGPGIPHTAYSAAKFAVKGFTEALLEDFRLNAPHVHASVVMPGHIGTEIVNNSRLVHGGDAEPGEEEMADLRAGMKQRGRPRRHHGRRRHPLDDEDVRRHVPRQRAHQRRRGGHRDPRRRPREPLADPHRRRRPDPRRSRARQPGARLRRWRRPSAPSASPGASRIRRGRR